MEAATTQAGIEYLTMKRQTILSSIQTKLITITITFTLIIASLTATLGFMSYRSILHENQRQNTTSRLTLLAETIQFDLDTAAALTDYCQTDSSILSYLEAAGSEKRTSTVISSAWNSMDDKYKQNPVYIDINHIIISDMNNQYLYFSSYSSPGILSAAQLIREMPFFDTAIASHTYISTGFIQGPFNDSQKGLLSLPIIRPIHSFYTKKQVGWCCLMISPDLFTRHLKNYVLEPDSMIYLSLGDTFYRWDGHALTETAPPDLSRDFVTYRAEDQNWYLLQPLSQIVLHKQLAVYAYTILALASAVILLGIGIALYYHRLINIPVQKLLNRLQMVSQGDFSQDPTLEWNNELGEIGRGINSMSSNISHLIESHDADQKKKYELEYEILQNQVNPHFLYNTLSSISWMATMQSSKGIMEMTSSLAFLLKSISKKVQTTYTLREELEFLDRYFLIMNYRYGGRLTLNTTVESEDLYPGLVPKFVLQIVVENAIFHGIEPKGDYGTIDIHIASANEHRDLCLSVTDDGIGMTHEQITQVLSHASGSSGLFRKIGIYNLQERIRYTYGTDYGITIESIPGEYTTVLILIPFKEKNN